MLSVFAQDGTTKAEQEMRNCREVQNTVLSNLEPDVSDTRKLSDTSHRLQLAPADAKKGEFSHCWPFLALSPGEKEIRVAKIKSL